MNFCQFPEFLPFEEDFSLFTNAQYSYDSQFADIQPTFWEQQLNPSTTTENDYYRLIGGKQIMFILCFDGKISTHKIKQLCLISLINFLQSN